MRFSKFGCISLLSVFGLLVIAALLTDKNFPSAHTNEAATVVALNKWWKETYNIPDPDKVGTVYPAKTVTVRGRVLKLKRHVKTKKEAEEETTDMLWMRHRESLVASFSVQGRTVTVHTTLTAAGITEARELCHAMGAFVWAHPYREAFGLENIVIAGDHGEALSARTGLRGNVQ